VKFLAERASDFSEKDVFEKLRKMMKFLIWKIEILSHFWEVILKVLLKS